MSAPAMAAPAPRRRSSLSAAAALLGLGKGGDAKSAKKKCSPGAVIVVAPKARVVEIPPGPVGVEFDGAARPPRISRVDESSPLRCALRPEEQVVSFTRPGLPEVDCAHLTGKDLVFALNHFKDVAGRSICIGQPKVATLFVQPGAEFDAALPPGRLGVSFVGPEIHAVNADSVLFGKVQARDVLLAVDGEPLPTAETPAIVAFLGEKDDGILDRTLRLRRGRPEPAPRPRATGGSFRRLGYIDTRGGATTDRREADVRPAEPAMGAPPPAAAPTLDNLPVARRESAGSLDSEDLAPTCAQGSLFT